MVLLFVYRAMQAQESSVPSRDHYSGRAQFRGGQPPADGSRSSIVRFFPFSISAEFFCRPHTAVDSSSSSSGCLSRCLHRTLTACSQRRLHLLPRLQIVGFLRATAAVTLQLGVMFWWWYHSIRFNTKRTWVLCEVCWSSSSDDSSTYIPRYNNNIYIHIYNVLSYLLRTSTPSTPVFFAV